ncbi:plastocyanin/azurin family copper-binding protein [Flavobacterium sp. 316]|uniref:plastocyanin/azurin family copper-binding protein n=1 Tax=Flavobacterium sp. 316 TaxID=1603293 RepID=UPI0006984315|nr:plastocyanin/azurin family copper-binding protein [Flavobacterium sp. 316]
MKKCILAMSVFTVMLFASCNEKKQVEEVVVEETPAVEEVVMDETPVTEIIKLEEVEGAFTTTELNLKPGTYSFEVTNNGIDHEVAFVLAPNKEDIQESDFIADAMLTKTIKDGETASSKVPVTLEKGEYVYFCPLNNTPKYKLIVE